MRTMPSLKSFSILLIAMNLFASQKFIHRVKAYFVRVCVEGERVRMGDGALAMAGLLGDSAAARTCGGRAMAVLVWAPVQRGASSGPRVPAVRRSRVGLRSVSS